jgi:predicted nuclease of predicted toxin-antitoxin system
VRLLIDMNLSPDWCPVLRAHGWDAVHWLTLGDPRAPDTDVMERARSEGRVVLTHDLGLAAILAQARAPGPSVVQIRAQGILPAQFAPILIPVLKRYEQEGPYRSEIATLVGKELHRHLPGAAAGGGSAENSSTAPTASAA